MVVCDATPVPLTVMVALRGADVVLAVTVTFITSLLLPEVGVTVTQEALQAISQSMLDVMTKDCSSLEGLKVKFESEKDIVGDGVTTSTPACATVTVCVNAPALTVIVAVLGVEEGLAVAVTVIVLSLFPDDDETVAHAGALLSTVQELLDVIPNDFDPAEAVNSSKEGETVKVGVGVTATPACVTVTVCVNPPAVTVIVAGLSMVEGLAVTSNLNLPLLIPDVVTMDNHVALLSTVQELLDDTSTSY